MKSFRISFPIGELIIWDLTSAYVAPREAGVIYSSSVENNDGEVNVGVVDFSTNANQVWRLLFFPRGVGYMDLSLITGLSGDATND